VSGASSRSTVAPSSAVVVCRLAVSDAELEAHYRLRTEVFVDEQRLFAESDRDPRDEQRGTLHALGLIGGEPCGAVRLYPLQPAGAEWKGDRLAVGAEHRAHHLGAELVRFAVRTAGLLGGRRMIAHVQLPNVAFFERLGWQAQAPPAPFHDVVHQLMSIGLWTLEGQ
jgi:putative N-acetyltransferase (TIGR04045 family)